MASRISRGQAQIANWISVPLAITILLVRFICGRHYQKSSFDITTVVILVSIAVLIARIVVSHLVLKYDTAIDILLEGVTDYNSLNLDKIKTGTILSLISRLLITTVYWLQCVLLLLFYTRILSHIHWVKVGIRTTWFVIGASYVAVVLSTFLECHPFRLYWQIQPDPGHCVKAYVQLFVQCICNIVIDLFLLAISYPVLNTQGHEWYHKCQIALLYILGAFCIVITCIRVVYIHGSNSAQPSRSFWASIQAVISTFVANAPSIYGQLQLKRRKRTQSSSKRRTAQPDTYVLMDEMTRRGSRPRGEDVDVEDCISNPTLGSDSFKREKKDENSSWISETEIMHPATAKETSQR
jgi:hypothetical protein